LRVWPGRVHAARAGWANCRGSSTLSAVTGAARSPGRSATAEAPADEAWLRRQPEFGTDARAAHGWCCRRGCSGAARRGSPPAGRRVVLHGVRRAGAAGGAGLPAARGAGCRVLGGVRATSWRSRCARSTACCWSAGRRERFVVTSHGVEHLERLRDAGRGAILLGAHVGSFEAMRAFAKDAAFAIHIVAYFHNARIINGFLETVDAEFRGAGHRDRPGRLELHLRGRRGRSRPASSWRSSATASASTTRRRPREFSGRRRGSRPGRSASRRCCAARCT
jgi:hypothetical protein